jgi:hypothetical protein
MWLKKIIQIYWFVTNDVLGGAAGIGPSSGQGQPANRAGRWLSPSFYHNFDLWNTLSWMLPYCVSTDTKL